MQPQAMKPRSPSAPSFVPCCSQFFEAAATVVFAVLLLVFPRVSCQDAWSKMPFRSCLAQRMHLLASSCDQSLARHSASGSPGAPAQMLRLLTSCPPLGWNTTATKQGIRVLLPGAAAGGCVELTNAITTYSTLVQLPILPDVPAVYQEALARSLSSCANSSGNASHHLWVLPESALGDGLAAGALQDLTGLLAMDTQLDFDGVYPNIKTKRAAYASKVAGVPWSTTVLSLFYRKDMFVRYNWTVPRTWQELMNTTAQINGTDGMYGFCSDWGPCHDTTYDLFRSILASYHQSYGPQEHWLIDSDTLDMLLNSPAILEALHIIKELRRYSAVEMLTFPSCTYDDYSFVKSQCIMSLSYNNLFKYISHVSQAPLAGLVQGNLGVSMLPGSNLVLDRATNTLVPCSLARCPYATMYQTASNRAVWINHSPTFDTLLLSLNSFQALENKFLAWMVSRYVASSTQSNEFVFHPSADVFPSRSSQLFVAKWVAAGFNANDAQEYVLALAVSLGHPNANQPLRFRGAFDLRSTVSSALTRLLQPNATTDQLLGDVLSFKSQLNASFQAVKAVNGSFRMDFMASLNIAAALSFQPTGDATVSKINDDDTSVSSGPSPALMAATIVVPIGVLAACFKLVTVRRNLLRGVFKPVHPGRGYMTTLLVTDIEGSTALWEELSAEVMDTSIKMHNACIRRLASEHRGYESCWEGDSFIIAFHTPQAAVQFCILAQKQLLRLAWPEALLTQECTRAVWVQRRPPAPAMHTLKVSPRLNSKDKGPHKGLACSTPCSPSRLTRFHTTPMLQLREPSVTSDVTSPYCSLPDHLLSGCSEKHKSASELQPEPDMPWSILAPANDNTPSMEISLSRGNTGLPEPDTVDVCTLGQEMVACWEVVPAGTPKAVLAYKGLRVRFGMHSGVNNDADIMFSKQMGRYHYSGPLRSIANAVASAVHGGQIMISGTTAAALDPQRVGMPCLLPEGCKLYHMGEHELNDVPELMMELIQVVPDSLGSRMALRQEQLKTLKCALPGVLSCPVPSQGFPSCPTHVVVRVVDLDALIMWDRFKLVEALQALLSCTRSTLSMYGGFVSKDGVSLALRRALVAPGLVPTQCSCMPGQYVAVLPNERLALHFALSLRHQLLNLRWDPDLLDHDLCRVERCSAFSSFQLVAQQDEPVDGTLSTDTLTSLYSSYRQVPLKRSGGARGIGPGLLLNHSAGIRQARVTDFGPPSPSPSVTQDSNVELDSPLTPLDNPHKSSFRSLRSAGLQNLAGSFPAPLLRGLCTKTVLLCGSATVNIDVRGTGRAVYHGKGLKQLTSLLASASRGDVLVTPQVAQLLMQSGLPLGVARAVR